MIKKCTLDWLFMYLGDIISIKFIILIRGKMGLPVNFIFIACSVIRSTYVDSSVMSNIWVTNIFLSITIFHWYTLEIVRKKSKKHYMFSNIIFVAIISVSCKIINNRKFKEIIDFVNYISWALHKYIFLLLNGKIFFFLNEVAWVRKYSRTWNCSFYTII